MQDDIFILGIETSCDETSAAVVKNGREVLSNYIYSQIDLHKLYGGVVPEIASRSHVEKINIVINEALKESGKSYKDITAVAVTYGPGLVGALLVGVTAAKAISLSLRIPLIGVNHIEGHICANYITNKELAPPYLCLIVSGGHTEIVFVRDYNEYESLGRTRDDAIGEAYDKVARVLGLAYPGGPKIDELAKLEKKLGYKFPRSYLEDETYDFSFSGTKSAVINYINTEKMKGNEVDAAAIAYEFQEAVLEVVSEKLVRAAKEYKALNIALAGGVSANSRLRAIMTEKSEKEGFKLYMPHLSFCTDNAAMIASSGYYKFIDGMFSDLSLNANASLKLIKH